MIKNILLTLFLIFIYSSSFSQTSFVNYKTEIIVIEEGIILERKLKSSDGSLISEEYKILIEGNYYPAVLTNGKWDLSEKGKQALEKSKDNKNMPQSSGGGCGG